MVATLTVLGDTVRLNDGTTIKGEVIDQGDKYWIKDSNGETRMVDKSAVASWTKGSDSPAAVPSITGTASAKPANAGSTSFAAVKAKAGLSETAIAAVGLWQAFIDSKPSATDLAAAKAELKHWQEVMDGSPHTRDGVYPVVPGNPTDHWCQWRSTSSEINDEL